MRVTTALKLKNVPQRKLTRGGRAGVLLPESAVDGSTFMSLKSFSV